MQDAQVLDVGLDPGGARRADRVVRPPERNRRKQLVAVHVAGERARLAHQGPDHVPVVDARGAVAEAIARELERVGVVDLEPVLVHVHPHALADQTRRHGVPAALDSDRAGPSDGHDELGVLGQPLDDERAHRLDVLGHARAAARVCLARDADDEALVLRLVGEVAAAAHEQRLLEPALESPVARFDVAVLLLRADGRRPRLHPEVPHHRLVLLIERAVRGVAGDLVRGRRRVIGLMEARHAPELEHRCLHASAQRRQRLRRAHGRPLPIRIRQHGHAQQVREHLPPERHAQLCRRREVRLRRLAGAVRLREPDLARRTVLRAPPPDPTL